jgi:hypothetical protein
MAGAWKKSQNWVAKTSKHIIEFTILFITYISHCVAGNVSLFLMVEKVHKTKIYFLE